MKPSPALAASRHTVHEPWFPAVKMPCLPGGNRIFTAPLTERITHYGLQAKPKAKGQTPLGNPGQQNRLNIHTFPIVGYSTFICCQLPPVSWSACSSLCSICVYTNQGQLPSAKWRISQGEPGSYERAVYQKYEGTWPLIVTPLWTRRARSTRAVCAGRWSCACGGRPATGGSTGEGLTLHMTTSCSRTLEIGPGVRRPERPSVGVIAMST